MVVNSIWLRKGLIQALPIILVQVFCWDWLLVNDLGYVLALKVLDGKLSWNETLHGYLDFVAANVKYKPGSWDAINSLSVESGKCQMKTEYTLFDVDPDTLKRTQRPDKITPFISNKIDSK